MTRSLGIICLSIYLILIGVVALFGVSLGGAAVIVPILAILAGVLLLLGK